MPKQSDDLTREGDEVQETPNAKLKIPVPTRDEVIGLFRKAARRRPDEGKQTPPSDPGKR
jgi:hypothetical protein